MNDIVIRTENVSKKFCKALKGSMFYGVIDIARGMLGFSNNTDVLRKDEFWAVQDVSFEVKQGEVLGIIGPNGSGKTTLLKMINGIFMPDKGKIEVNGRVGALIEVGAGFHPLLTGRENIYVNGAILGMSKKEIDRKFTSIIEFADIGDFLDTPVKYYSSGMFVRLGFAVAIHSRPNILLIDEVLAVGDVAFRLKCFNHIRLLIEKGVAIILVSHNLSELVRVCNSGIVLDCGKQINGESLNDAIQCYQKIILKSIASERKKRNCPVKIESVRILDNDGVENEKFRSGDNIVLEISYKSKISASNSVFVIKIVSQEIGPFVSFTNLVNRQKIPIACGKGKICVKLYALSLIAGNYSIEVHLYDAKMETFWDQAIPACNF
ncbi:MAG: ABC transporter ATP-binding protein, partial [candidate division Zixibacteria bacterium]|nr:ABC transporter ATP-binding protein [candidate division Zixibacteria bacterium]